MSTRLYLTTPCDEMFGHVYHLRIEEGSGHDATVDGAAVEMPWLRAACSCGWKAKKKQRFTIEENAHYLWAQHVGAVCSVR